MSQPFESLKIAMPPDTAAVPAKPAPPATPGSPTSPAEHHLLKTCWSCHVLSGLRLMGAGGYVYWVARKPMKMGYPPGPWTIMKMVMGLSIAAEASSSWHHQHHRHGRPQREGLPHCLKVPPVNLSSVPAPMTHRAGMEFNGCSGQTLVHGQTSLLWILQD